MDEAAPQPKASRAAASSSSALASGPGRDLDHISELPDCLLGDILLRLPITEAARTAVLSSRWRDVFTHAPIELDDDHVASRRAGRPPADPIVRARLAAAIARILAAHRGAIPRVRLHKTCFHEGDWVKELAGRGVQELVLRSTTFVQFFPCPPLRSLNLAQCSWFSPCPPPNLKHLAELTLHGVKISEADLHALMDQCVGLQSLVVSSYSDHCWFQKVDVVKFHVRSQSLRSLTLELCSLEELVIMEAPNLERVLGEPKHSLCNCEVKIVNAPKLEIIGMLTMKFHLVEFNSILCKGMYMTVRSPIPSIKSLALCVNLGDCDQVKKMLEFLKFFPSLKTLHIKNYFLSVESESSDASYQEFAGSVPCLGDHLKTIILSRYSAEHSELQFAKVILRTGKVLKVMTFLTRTCSKVWVKRQKRLFGRESIASLDVKVVFIKNRYNHRNVLLDASNLALPDPFFVRKTIS